MRNWITARPPRGAMGTGPAAMPASNGGGNSRQLLNRTAPTRSPRRDAGDRSSN